MEELFEKYNAELHKLQEVILDDPSKIDPDNECDWHDLCLGFLMGQGVPQEDANEILIYIAY